MASFFSYPFVLRVGSVDRNPGPRPILLVIRASACCSSYCPDAAAGPKLLQAKALNVTKRHEAELTFFSHGDRLWVCVESDRLLRRIHAPPVEWPPTTMPDR